MAGVSRISSNTPWEPVYGYSRAVKAGNLIVVSGTTAFDQSGSIIGINQMYSQTRQAIANIAAALERAGAGLGDVIRTRVFVTDVSRFEEVARAHRDAFGQAPPASTLVEVRRLVHPDMLVEIEADAVIDDGRDSAGESSAPESVRSKARREAPTTRSMRLKSRRK